MNHAEKVKGLVEEVGTLVAAAVLAGPPMMPVLKEKYGQAFAAIDEMQAEIDRLKTAMRIAVTQNEHDMLMTGDELRYCRAAMKERGEGV